MLKSGPQLGSYEVEALLGKGRMGEVYLARHLRLSPVGSVDRVVRRVVAITNGPRTRARGMAKRSAAMLT